MRALDTETDLIMKTKFATFVMAVALVAGSVGCMAPTNNTERGAMNGAVLGGILGGVIGHNKGRKTAEGAAIGALGGALLGGAVGNAQDKKSGNK